MLFTAMMKKFDDEKHKEFVEARKAIKDDEAKVQKLEKDQVEPLLSQNISVIEVGAYSHLFSTFLGFLGIKTLIVTDLDCAKPGDNKKLKKCRFSEGTTTTNASIKYFTSLTILSDIVELAKNPLVWEYKADESKWEPSSAGKLRLIVQKEENGYQARSFEDAFISVNHKFLVENKNSFTSLKNRSKLILTSDDYYMFADECINSKTGFALDILLYGGTKNEKWITPLYIKEGLEWLVL